MKNRTLLFVPLLTVLALATAGAQSPDGAPADLQKLLQDALFAEEATQDLPKAAASYEAVMEAYAGQRRLAATALFRLAEVRRKQNRPQDAIAHYQHLLRDFAAEETLARLSRENLLALGVEDGELASPPPDHIDDEETREIARLKELIAKSPDLLRAPVKVEGEEVALPHLHRAAAAGQLRVIDFLLEQGLSVNGGALRLAAEAGQKAACELLLQHGADINEGNPLFAALRNGHMILAEFLLEKGADPDQRDIGPMRLPVPLADGSFDSDIRPLHWAVWEKEMAVIDLLLKHDADVNATLNNGGVTPLHLAAHHDDADLLQRLIDHGADVARATQATTISRPKREIEGGVTPLHVAVRSGYQENVKVLLASNAPVDAVTEKSQRTPLYMATSYALPEIVRLLLEHGASPNLAVADGRTPLHNVCDLGLEELAMLLLEKGAEIDARINSGYTPLMTAATSEVPADFLIALVENGASLDAVQADGKSTLELASRANRVPLMRRFRYPEWVKEDSVRLSFPQLLYTHALATLDVEGGRPPGLADALLSWTDVPEDNRSTYAARPEWSNARIFRRQPDSMSVIELQLRVGEPLPELAWGDVIEVTTATWEQQQTERGGQYSDVSWELPSDIRGLLEAAVVRHVTINMADIEKQLTLRGRLQIYNPLTDEAPLLPLGPLVRLLGGGASEHIHAKLVVHRRPDRGGGTITTQLDWSEAEQLILMDGDRIEVTPLPSNAQQKEPRISLISPGLLVGESYPSATRIPNWEGYSDPPTLVQFLTWHYAPISLELWGATMPREQARQFFQEWSTDPDALAKRVIDYSRAMEPRAILPYPDWSKLVIKRLTEEGWNETIPVDLEAAMRACDETMTEEEARAFDVPLQFGDLVELPVLEERSDEPWTGFDEAAVCLFEKALARSITFQGPDGDFRGVKLRWIPSVYIPTTAGLVPFPKEFPEFGKVTVPLADHLVSSEGGLNQLVEEVRREGVGVEAGSFTWLEDGDRVISRFRPKRGTRAPSGKRRIILPPPGLPSR